jgi:hypothetical protein
VGPTPSTTTRNALPGCAGSASFRVTQVVQDAVEVRILGRQTLSRGRRADRRVTGVPKRWSGWTATARAWRRAQDPDLWALRGVIGKNRRGAALSDGTPPAVIATVVTSRGVTGLTRRTPAGYIWPWRTGPTGS